MDYINVNRSFPTNAGEKRKHGVDSICNYFWKHHHGKGEKKNVHRSP